MNRIEKNDLVYRLAFKMLSAKYDAETKRRERNRKKNGSLIEVCEGVSPKRMSDEHFYQLVHFYDFIIKNEHLSDAAIIEIFSTETECYAKRFKYLLILNSKIPNFIEELRTLGPERFALRVIKKSNDVNETL